MKSIRSIWLAVIGLLFAVPAAESAQRIIYDFTSIADDIRQPGQAQTLVPPAINDAGTVAFTIDVGGPVGSGIFSGSGGPLTTIVVDGAFHPSGRPSINDAGLVAFNSAVAPEGVFTGSGGPITTIADTSGLFRPGGFGGFPSVNDSGAVTFFSSFRTGGSGVFVGSGGPLTTIADTNGAFSSFFGAPSTINDKGSVAFLGTLRTGVSGVFLWNSGPITTIADTNGPFSGFFGGTASINDQAVVAFLATQKSGGQGIFKGDGTQTVTFANTSGPFNSFGADPSINDAGTVLFDAFLKNGKQGIFTGPDPDVDNVIFVGDSLFGSTVKTLLIGPEGLNDAGQIAFIAELANGKFTIARADPVGVVEVTPEPNSLMLCLLGLGGFLVMRRKMRR